MPDAASDELEPLTFDWTEDDFTVSQALDEYLYQFTYAYTDRDRRVDAALKRYVESTDANT